MWAEGKLDKYGKMYYNVRKIEIQGDEMKNGALSETTIVVRVPRSLKEALMRIARQQTATLSQIIRELLARAVSKQGDDDEP